MKLRLWWVPLLLAFAPAFGLAPQHRDLPDFFAPMRAWTADRLLDGEIPWLNPLNGGGEAWFANPETGLLYPPAWIHLMLPTEWALTIEIAIHLAWLSLGAGLLARRWGADDAGRGLAEMLAWSAGPVVAAIGVLNNLETLAWIPWMVLAASRQSVRWIVPAVAVTTAMGWLAGEPQLWALGVAMMVASAPRTRVAVGLLLAVALVVVQMVPFGSWVLEGDRGPARMDDLLRGHLAPVEWLGLVHPMPPTGERMVFVESLFVSVPVVVLMLLGARRRPWVAVAGGALLLFATLPAIGGGGLYLTLTGGLVRYPSRFALVGVAMLLPVAALGWTAWRDGQGRAAALLAVGLGALGVALYPGGASVWLTLVPSLVVLAAVVRPDLSSLRTGSVALGVTATIAASVTLLDLAPGDRLAPGTAWPEVRGAGRLWSPTPDRLAIDAVSADLDVRRRWPMGYLNLTDAIRHATTPAPVTHRALRHHLAEVDRGPEARWWLDVLGARWVVLPPGSVSPPDLDPIVVRNRFTLWRNPRSVPMGRRTPTAPAVDRPPRPQPALTVIRRDLCGVRIATLGTAPGVVWTPLAPVTGWTWTLDDRSVRPVRGPGIVQYLEVPPGLHRIEGRYRPPGWPATAVVSLLAAAVLVIVTIRCALARYDAGHEGGA